MAIDVQKLASGTSPVRETGPVQPAAAPARESGGGVLPPGGNDRPPVEVPAVDISRAISNLNQFLQDSQRDLMFRLDQASGRVVITILNPNTGEIVRQIPPDEVLKAARNLREAGILLSAHA